jgi:hypothetical protein
VTAVTGTSPITSTGGTTPAIGCATCDTGSGTANYYPLFTGANTLGNGHLDDGVTTASTITSTEPFAIAAGSLATQETLTYNAGHAPAGTAGSAVVAPDTSGNLDVNENNTGFSRICTAANGQCTGSLSGTGTANYITKWTGTNAVGNSQTQDDGTHAVLSGNGYALTSTGGISFDAPNNATGGTAANKMACKSAAGTMATCGTAVVAGVQGVAIAGLGTAPGTTGNVSICFSGNCQVYTDNAATIGHYAIHSSTTAGDVHDSGATTPTAGVDNFLITATAAANALTTVQIGTPDWYASSTNNPLSGMTATQVAIAGSATTVTSSKALAGSGAGITTGPTTSVNTDCAQFTGTAGQIADSGSPCGGSGTVSGQANGVIPLATGATTIGGQSHIDDGNTTASTLTATEPFVAPGITSDALQRGNLVLTYYNANITTLPANSAGFAAPNSGGTSWLGKLPSTITAGILHFAAPATADGVNESAITSSAVNLGNSDVTGILPVANGGTGTSSGIVCGSSNFPCTNTTNTFSTGPQIVQTGGSSTVGAVIQGSSAALTPTFVQAATGVATSGAVTATFGSNVTAGHAIILFLTGWAFVGNPTCTDSLSTSFSVITNANDGTEGTFLVVGLNTSGGADTVSCTLGGNMALSAAEYSGIATSSAVDVYTTASPGAAGSTESVGPITTTASDLILTALGASSGRSAGSGATTGYTTRSYGGSVTAYIQTADKNGSASSYSATWDTSTFSGANAYLLIVGLKAGVAGQSADLLDAKNNSGTVLGSITALGQYRSVPVTFATLQSCASGVEGTSAAVSDSTTNTWGATITGGGSDHVLAYCDGTNWTVGAK